MKPESIDAKIKMHEGLIFYTLNILNCKPDHELISAGYEALWRAIETFDENNGASFSTYAVTCIKNALLGALRKRHQINEMEVSLEDYPNLSYNEDFLYEEQEANYESFHIAVDEVLSKLSGKRREVAKIWVESNMSTTAIAAEVSCSQSYASQAIKEVQHLLRKELHDARSCRDYPKSTAGI